MKWRDITQQHNGKRVQIQNNNQNKSFLFNERFSDTTLKGEILVFFDGRQVFIPDKYTRDVEPKRYVLLPPDIDVDFIEEETFAQKETMENHIQILPIIPCAKWTDDCQGKKDYDGRLLSISTRYWPTGYSAQPSAHTAIHINWGEPDQYGYGDYTVLRSAEFTAQTEDEVKTLVEAWVKEQMTNIVKKLID